MSIDIYPKEIFFAMLAQQTNRNEEMITKIDNLTQEKESLSIKIDI